MRVRDLLLRAAFLILAAAGCEKKDAKNSPGQTAPAQGGSDAAPAAALPSADARPALPELGPPPAGMDAAQAAACDEGDAKACLAAARSIEPTGGWRSGKTPEEADELARNVARYAQRACDLGIGDACAMAAHFWKWHSPEQFAALERGCELGNMGACGTRGWSLLTTGNSHEDKRRGLELMEKSCRGNGIGYGDDQPGFLCDQAALFFRSTDKPLRDLAKAKALKALGCQQGHKLECPCASDPDCGGGDYYCHEGKCTLPSSD